MSRNRANGHRWRRTRLEVLDRDARICWLCGHPGADQVDHVIPKAHGGSDHPDNLRAAHGSCNTRKSDKLPHQLGPALRTSRRW